MPNGDPHFDLRRQEQWFAPLANGIKPFALGNASISISDIASDHASIGSSWYVDDYDQFTRSIHWRGARSIPKEPELVREALEEEFHAVIGAPLGAWNQVARGYEDSWGEYTKEQFYALGPHYPKPVIGKTGA